MGKWAPQVVVIAALAWAVWGDSPYGYYVLLRWVCCGVFAWLTYRAIEADRARWAWALGIAAIAYNPLVPLHLGREIWTVINLATAVLAGASIWALRPRAAPRTLTPR